MQRLGPLLLAAVLGSLPSPARAAEGTTSPVGEARLPSGLVAHYDYHFDRNALLASHRAGDALVALTRSGNLLRFDATTLKLTREWSSPAAATCLGRGEGDAVLVGFDDGRVCRVDPTSLALEDVAKLPESVRWVGASKGADGRGGIVAVVEHARSIKQFWGRTTRRTATVHDLSTGRAFPLKSKSLPAGEGTFELVYDPSSILLDGRRRLWLGGALSDWGGWCLRVDLDEGRVVEVEGPQQRQDGGDASWEGIYGFVERPDGQVWAHGGENHMGFLSGFVCRADGPAAELLYRYPVTEARRGREQGDDFPETQQTYGPITHIVTDGDGKLLVFSCDEIYCTDTRLKVWSKDRALKLRYRFGRSSPIVAFHRLGDHLLCATASDGHLGLGRAGEKDTTHALPGQFGIDSTEQIANSAEGTLFLSGDTEEVAWHVGPGGWEVAALAPPAEPDPGEPRVEGEEPSWGETRVMVGRSGAIWTASGPGWFPGTRVFARRVGGKSEVLGRESSNLTLAACFITPDGILWNAGVGDLKRFADGRWEDVAKLPGADPAGLFDEPRREGFIQVGDPRLQVGWGLHAVSDAGPPWILLDRDQGQLLRLAYGPDFKAPQLDAVKVVEAGNGLEIRDAIPWAEGDLLLATDQGVRRFVIAPGEVRPAPLPDPGRPVTSLARDGLGRVWIGGDGLWLVDPDGKALHDAAAVPMLGRSSVTALAADPGRRDGVIVSLGIRGVVFVRVAPAS